MADKTNKSAEEKHNSVDVNNKRQDFALLIECLVLVLSSVVFLGLTVHWRVRRDANTGSHTAELCVDCVELKPWYDQENISRQVEARLERDGNTCCGNADEILRYSARKQIMEGFYLQSTHSYPHGIKLLCDSHEQINPYAKLVGISGTKGGLVTILWNKNGNTTVGPTIQDITHLHDEGEIFIRRPGNYVVSVTLVMKTNASIPNQGTVSYFIHVLSHKHGTQRVLAERRMSFNAMQHSTSTSRGVYRLDLHDRLSVATTHLEYIDISNNDNVFSVHLS